MAKQIHVAVVHTDPVFLRLAALILKDGGYLATTCRSGPEAHGTVLASGADVVVVDTWPESRGEGWDLVQTLRLDEATKHIPIILTSSDPKDARHRAADSKAMRNVLVLGKPFVPEVLLAAVKRVTSLSAGLDNAAREDIEYLPD